MYGNPIKITFRQQPRGFNPQKSPLTDHQIKFHTDGSNTVEMEISKDDVSSPEAIEETLHVVVLECLGFLLGDLIFKRHKSAVDIGLMAEDARSLVWVVIDQALRNVMQTTHLFFYLGHIFRLLLNGH